MNSKDQLTSLSRDVLRFARNTLLVNLRFLDAALSRLTPVEHEKITFGTDAKYLVFQPKYLLKSYTESSEFVVRSYLHSLMHCVFRHPFVSTMNDQRIWNLACDIAVEHIINGLDVPAAATSKQAEQETICQDLEQKVKVLTAEFLYRHFLDHPLKESEFSRLETLFALDDHQLWYMTENAKSTSGVGKQDNQNQNDSNQYQENANSHNQQEQTNSDSNQNEESDSQNQQEQNKSDSNQNEESDSQNQQEQNKSDSNQNEESDSQNQQEQNKSDSDQNEESDSQNQQEQNKSDSDQSEESDSQNQQEQNDSDSDQNEDSDSQNQDEQSDDSTAPLNSEEDWKEISERIQVDMETLSQMKGDSGGSMMQALRELNRERYDYTAFLKKFAVMGEAMKINDDEFDYIFYTYGLKLYKNMPLIEPLEYKDVKRIREFVIAIDTSGSVEGELVQTFLQKTYNIMKQTDSFFSKINVHIIQCDAEIQEHVRITSQEEFDRYLKTMEIHGLGGTDFRPVFRMVDTLCSQGEFANLKGLIYFTDGYGDFPERKPFYETAFVFIEDEWNNYDVPPWAIKLILRKDEI